MNFGTFGNRKQGCRVSINLFITFICYVFLRNVIKKKIIEALQELMR